MNRMKSLSRACAGFTLMEVLVALTIFSITSLAATRLIVGATALVSENNTASLAISLAQGTIENLRNVAYEDMVSDTEIVVLDNITFTITWTVSDDDPAPDMKTVVVNVSWEAKGEAKHYEIESIYSQVTA